MPNATTQLEPLLQRVQFEQRVVQQPMDGPVQVKLTHGGRFAEFHHDQKVLVAELERPLIHQLGQRLWGIQDYSLVAEAWHRMNPAQLEQALASVFSKHDLVARYFVDQTGVNRVYGFVSPHFVDVNPLSFREQFVEQIRQSTSLTARSDGLTIDKYQNVVEWFDFHSFDCQTKYKYGLYYARNSGYDAYKVLWGREIIICTNGLKTFEQGRSRWKHTREIELGNFIEDTIQEGLGNQQWLEQRIDAARASQLANDEFNELMARLSLASATKERVRSRVDIEAQEVGRNEWALSQALTWLGSHDRHVATRTKQQLTTLGTEVLEKALPQVLTAKCSTLSDGMYGILLPSRF